MPSMFGSSCYQVSADLYKLDSTSVSSVSNDQTDLNKASSRDTSKSNPVLTVVGFIGGFAIGYLLVTILLNEIGGPTMGLIKTL